MSMNIISITNRIGNKPAVERDQPAEVIDLDDFRPRLSGNVKCLACDHNWDAVVAVGATWLECPECFTLRGVFVNPVIPPCRTWQCDCGGWLFYALERRNTYQCASCGDLHKQPD